MKISYKEVRQIYQTDKLKKLSDKSITAGTDPDIDQWLTDTQDHYGLLFYIASKFNNSRLIDLGTHRGCSALCLSHNTSNKVVTYDRCKVRGGPESNLKSIPKNLTIKVDDIFKIDNIKDWLDSDFIFIDINHEGVDEKRIYDILVENNYKGITMWDDIHHQDYNMSGFWNSIPDKIKYDITEIGHTEKNAGTGLIDFSNKVNILP